MRNTLLITLVLIAGFQLSLQSKLHTSSLDVNTLDVDNYINRQRDLTDVWNKIKSKIIIAWENFKHIANNTKIHVKDYLKKIKEKINIIRENFEKKLVNLKKDFKKIMENAVTAGKNVKKCLKDDKENIETLLEEILMNVTICISNNVNYISKQKMSHNSLDFNDTIFLSSVENNMKETLKNCEENNHSCLDIMQEKILIDLDVATWNISHKALEMRNVVVGGLDSIVMCVTEGLTKASISIVNETVQIIHCAKDKQ